MGKNVAAICCFLACVVASVGAQGSGASEKESVRRFVQSFYDWYCMDALAMAPADAPERALTIRRDMFSPTLARALDEDLAAQRRVKGEIVGLDFDPIVGSQNPAVRYKVAGIIRNGRNYRVQVRPVGDADPAHAFVVELARRGDGGWQIANFHYPYRGTTLDLLEILRRLKANRQRVR